jgi:rhamnose transport system substrate-binding protein
VKKTLGLIVAALALAGSTAFPETSAAADKKITVAWLSISNDNAYFISCRQGAEKAAKELGVNLISDGPAHPDPAKQIEIVDHWASLGVDAIAAACDSRDGLSPALRRAQEKGIKVITFDADAQANARSFFVNQATAESIGTALMDDADQLCGPEGQYAIITANLTSANENEWLKYIDARNQSSCPGLKRVALRACGDNIEKARVETAALLKAYPDLKLVMAICSPGVPGAAQAVKEAGKIGQVKVIGLGLPNENKQYVHEGVTNNIILWKTRDLGDLTLRAAVALVKGTLRPGDKSFSAGSLGDFEIHGDEIWLGKPFTFDKDNIDQFDF